MEVGTYPKRGLGTTETAQRPGGAPWKDFVRRHWRIALLIVGGIAAAAVAALFVLLWVVADLQATGRVPPGLGDWTVGHAITFILYVILWELLLVASWVCVAGLAAYFLWYRKLPDAERSELEGGPRRARSAGASGGFSFFVALVWLAIVWTDGRWNLALKDWTFNNLVYSWIAAGLVVLLIVGIPGIIYLVWALRRNG